MTKHEYSVEEVRALAKYLQEGTPNWYRESYGDFKSSVHTCDNAPKNAVPMLTAHADLLEQIEQAKAGVTDEIVNRACDVYVDANHPLFGEGDVPVISARMRAAIQAVAHLLQSGERDSYEGAREDLLDWKHRALSAESILRSLGYKGLVANEPPAQAAQGEAAHQVRSLSLQGGWSEWADITKDHFDTLSAAISRGACLQTRVLYTAQPRAVPDGWSGWAVQYPDRLPKLFGAREIAELNWEAPAELIHVVEVERVAAPQPGECHD